MADNERLKRTDPKASKKTGESKRASSSSDNDAGGSGSSGSGSGGASKWFEQQPWWVKVGFAVLGAQVAYWLYLDAGRSGRTVTPHEFITAFVSTRQVRSLQIVTDRNIAIADLHTVNAVAPGASSAQVRVALGDVETFERQVRAAEVAANVPIAERLAVRYTTASPLSEVASRLLPTLLLVAATVFIVRRASAGMSGGGGGPGGLMFGKTKAKMYNKDTNVKVRFADVAGVPEAKQEIFEFVDFLRDPTRFQKLGAKIPRGALLVGPPGNGKTLLAKAAAGEAGVPFFVTSGAEFLEMFVGVGPSRVRDLFKEARKHAPAIVFIDEIDAIGRARSNSSRGGSHDERESTLNALLVEMDGFSSTDNIVVLAGTNRVDVLDKALLRPGRFDRQITIDNPDVKARAQIFAVHLRPLKLDPAVDTALLCDRLAKLTPGFSGADVANVCNEAALVAARENALLVRGEHFDKAIERVIGGIEKQNRVLSVNERRAIAYHEAGHAVVAWMLQYCDPVLKLSIVPRGTKPTGFAQYDGTDKFLLTREQLLDRVCQRLAGRASEQERLGVITTAAEDDLRYVTQLAYTQIAVYGMSDSVGNVSFQGNGARAMYSDQTAQMIDAEVRSFLMGAYERTRALVAEHAAKVDKVAELLLERETLMQSDVEQILGAKTNDATSTAPTRTAAAIAADTPTTN
jgi:AFG3 family protein